MIPKYPLVACAATEVIGIEQLDPLLKSNRTKSAFACTSADPAVNRCSLRDKNVRVNESAPSSPSQELIFSIHREKNFSGENERDFDKE
jgi:hypothetical protein